ncbi:MAG: hypothetical protein A7315_12435 [Candidatus Altiarchaeales archaeon WOR_SM1_79]|nr:MAG: hypothetical protein A7315_12435 [Candidatus Altiarchaeales archaeon WOR_SM1_79]
MKKINIIIIPGLIFILVGFAAAEEKTDTKIEIVYEKYSSGWGEYYEGDTIYLLRNTHCTLQVIKAEVRVEIIDIPPEYRQPGMGNTYKIIEDNFPINGTAKLKIFKDNKLIEEIETEKSEKDDDKKGRYYSAWDGAKLFKVNLDEGKYVFKLEVDGSILANSERMVEVIREKGQDVVYMFGYQNSESPTDTVYMTKSNEVAVGFEIRKEIEKEYFDKIGYNMMTNDRAWVDVETDSEMILELSGGGEVKRYNIEKNDDNGWYDNHYLVNIKNKGNYDVRLINKETGEVLEGSERIIRVVDVNKSFIPFLFAAFPLVAGIVIIILRKKGYRINLIK